MFGYGSDLERVEMLYTSLLVQMAHGLAKAHGPAQHPKHAGLAAELAARLHVGRDRAGPGG